MRHGIVIIKFNLVTEGFESGKHKPIIPGTFPRGDGNMTME